MGAAMMSGFQIDVSAVKLIHLCVTWNDIIDRFLPHSPLSAQVPPFVQWLLPDPTCQIMALSNDHPVVRQRSQHCLTTSLLSNAEPLLVIVPGRGVVQQGGTQTRPQYEKPLHLCTQAHWGPDSHGLMLHTEPELINNSGGRQCLWNQLFQNRNTEKA